MSTFCGKIAEIPGISIDRFNCDNLNSEAFFLSHCHTDHMEGLADSKFHDILIKNDYFLYLSHVSAGIIRRMHPAISTQLRELDLHLPTAIQLRDMSISVFPVPAGHCPGSVMFLFESDKIILYTGDYRIKPTDMYKFKAFYNAFNQLKVIDKIYLDTTFFLKSYLKFPMRSESLEEICSIIKSWISRGPKNMIKLHTSAKYGYEYLFIEIYNQLKMPVHVNDEMYDFYSSVPEMDKAVTKLRDTTQIHCACGSHYTTICKNSITYQVRTIKISAWRWQNDGLQNGISDSDYGTYYVCYSTHASYEEGAELIKFLKPKKIEPNVLHSDEKTNLEIYKNIEENLQQFQKATIQIEKPKLFEINKSSQLSGGPCLDEEKPSHHSSILDSPPRKRSK